ncbi:hypothetical protein VIN7_6028 [Saccharomyces cerevisiae x Saccharomyces kudriavzevii VIN7]|uniref:Uncharacterized protein n=1 Tax=Saccharomyces cerevisiae x Saccharomyces kudriavzevii (strain VIN7) TaxID=1095631 RepID=H0GSA4_SACCK|nr:hypothetical protein VIN7_6028 [Saccharomyces cerevisiae x Saccharomyces kudriavzevii VIN7]
MEFHLLHSGPIVNISFYVQIYYITPLPLLEGVSSVSKYHIPLIILQNMQAASRAAGADIVAVLRRCSFLLTQILMSKGLRMILKSPFSPYCSALSKLASITSHDRTVS